MRRQLFIMQRHDGDVMMSSWHVNIQGICHAIYYASFNNFPIVNPVLIVLYLPTYWPLGTGYGP